MINASPALPKKVNFSYSMMKRLNYWAVLFILFTFSRCQTKVEKSSSILEKTKASNIDVLVHFTPQPDNDVYLSYLDEVNDRQTFEFYKSQKADGKFKVATDQPIFMLDWTPNQIYYVLYPGETIQVTAANKSKETLSLSSSVKDSIRGNEFKFFEALSQNEATDLSKKTNAVLKKLYRPDAKTGPGNARILVLMDLLKRKKSKDPDLSYKFISSRYKKRADFLNDFAIANPISAKYKQLVSQFFKYEIAADLLEVLNHALKKNIPMNDSLVSYGNNVLKSLNCDSCLSIPTYQYAVKNYLSFSFARNGLNTLKSKVDYVNENFKAETRDFCLFLVFKNQEEFEHPSDRSMVMDFTKQCKKPAYVNYLKNKLSFYNDNGKSNTGKETVLHRGDGSKITFEKLIDSIKGSVVLVDFWASWCTPCKIQMPFSHQLNEEFKHEKFTILYLSLDKSANDWLKSTKTLNLEAHSYLVDKDFKSPIAKGFQITAIPRYVLIDKKGSVVTSTAARPSDPELKEMIKKLINR